MEQKSLLSRRGCDDSLLPSSPTCILKCTPFVSRHEICVTAHGWAWETLTPRPREPTQNRQHKQAIQTSGLQRLPPHRETLQLIFAIIIPTSKNKRENTQEKNFLCLPTRTHDTQEKKLSACPHAPMIYIYTYINDGHKYQRHSQNAQTKLL